MIPIADDNSDLRLRPFVSWSLLLGCLAVWLWQLTDFSAIIHTWAAVPWELVNGENLAGLSVSLEDRKVPVPHRPTPEPWLLWVTPLTAMFLHGDWLHLGCNLLYLWVFADNVEDRLGHSRFLCFYLGCGLIACAAHVGYDPTSKLPMVGASGAIAGVLGAYLRLHPWRWVLVIAGKLPLPLPAFVVLGFWFAVQWLGLRGHGTAIAYAAHVGGFLAGLMLVGWFRPGKER